MKRSDWAQKDYEIARQFIEDNEEEASRNPLLDCGQGVTAVLPLEGPGLGFRLHGLIMLAPLPLLMLCAILVPIFGFTGNWEVSLTTVSITIGCAVMVLGLSRAIRLVVAQRETFPRQYFATLGTKGVAMHFSRFQFPLQNPRQEFLWKQLDSFKTANEFFLPGFLNLTPWLPTIRIQTREGLSLILPAPSNPEHLSNLKNRLESFQA